MLGSYKEKSSYVRQLLGKSSNVRQLQGKVF